VRRTNDAGTASGRFRPGGARVWSSMTGPRVAGSGAAASVLPRLA